MSKKVLTVDKNDIVYKALKKMASKSISGLIVTANGKPWGIITERDFLLRAPMDFKKLQSSKVKDIMSKDLITVQPNGHA